MKTLLTVITGTNRPNNIKELIDNLEATATYPEQIEVIFAIDQDDKECIDAIEEVRKYSKIIIKYLEGHRSRGYFEANIHYNNCLHLSNPDSYFFVNFSDKSRIKTKGWDEKLKQYVKYFKDDVFRVRISIFKNIRYNANILTALTKPDNFAFHTRKFLELSGGWGDNWGPDTWAQGIVFFCELLGINDRDLVANDIDLEEYHYTKPSSIKQRFIRDRMINWSFKFLSSSEIALSNFYRIALKIKLYIESYEVLKRTGTSKYRFIINANSVSITDSYGVAILSQVFDENKLLLMSFMNRLSNIDQIINKINRRSLKHQNKKGIKKIISKTNIILSKLFLLIESKKCLTKNNFKYIYSISDKIIPHSTSDQFIIEQNLDIEKMIRHHYYKTIFKSRFTKENS